MSDKFVSAIKALKQAEKVVDELVARAAPGTVVSLGRGVTYRVMSGRTLPSGNKGPKYLRKEVPLAEAMEYSERARKKRMAERRARSRAAARAPAPQAAKAKGKKSPRSKRSP